MYTTGIAPCLIAQYLLSRIFFGFNYPSFFLDANASKKSIKIAKIACSMLQIKMATLKEALKVFAVLAFLQMSCSNKE